MGLFRRKEKPEERADPGREVDASDFLLLGDVWKRLPERSAACRLSYTAR